MAVLDDATLRARLATLEGWKGDASEISKEYSFETFMAAIEFVNDVARLAEDANHHPDIDIRWRKVRLALCTHSEGGVTEKDLDLAAKINDLIEKS